MKKTLQSAALIGAFCGSLLHASWEFRTPLSAEWRGYFHWQLPSVADAWWYDTMPSKKEHTTWDFHFWGVGYSRTADKAFSKCGCKNKVTRHTTSLASLWFGEFGQTEFRGEDVFTNGTFTTASATDQALMSNTNPFLGFAFIKPVFEYEEHGAFMGLEFSRNFGKNDKWHAGGRISIPYKVIEIEQNLDASSEETLGDVVSTRPVKIDETATGNEIEYAYRFDFLNSLVFNTVTTPSNLVASIPVVVYPANNETLTIAGRDVMGTTSSDASIAAYATISVDCQGNVTLPALPYRKLPSEATGVLGVDGQGTDGSSLFFEDGLPYGANLGQDRFKQGQIFIVPRAEILPGNTSSTITADAQAIYTAITNLLDSELLVSQTGSTFFLNNGIDLFASSRNVGIGDLAAEAYVGYGDKEDWFFDGILGLSLPTGKRQKNSNDVYWKATGNNGHLEIKLGIDTGWMPRPWFAFEIDAAYHHAFKRSEKRAAPFVGATVINIGPEIEADVSWNYFVGRLDLNFFHPHNPDLGFTFGYELFAKGKDKVGIDCKTATDFLGRTEPLAPCNYEKRTNALSNKLRAQIFNRWNYFEIFGGGSQVVSGRDVMKETEAHLGFVVYF